MQITKVEIQNFRNIKNETYELGHLATVRGKNHIGKTNTLQAIYWALADALIDNSKTFDSILPADNTRALASVKLYFGNLGVFEKTYREKWTRTRGSDEERLTGRETSYTFNGSPISSKGEAVSILTRLLFGDKEKCTVGLPIDLTKALINPLYLFGQEDWKSARQYIISLVGDIKDEDVFANNPDLMPLKADLITFSGRTDLLSKKYSNDVRALGSEIKELEAIINNDSYKITANDVSQEELEEADKLQKEYESITLSAKTGLANPMITKLEEEVSKITADISKTSAEINEEEKAYRDEYESLKKQKADEYKSLDNEVNAAERALTHFAKDKEDLAQGKEDTRKEIIYLQGKRKGYIDRYHEIKNKEFVYSETKCPRCGAVLNEDEINQAREEFNTNKARDLENCTNEGKAVSSKISLLEAKEKDYEVRLTKFTESAENLLKMRLEDSKGKREEVLNELRNLNPRKSARYDELNTKQAELEKVKANLASIKNGDLDRAKEYIAHLNEEWAERLATVDETKRKKIIHDEAENELSEKTAEKTALGRQLADIEANQELLKRFITARLAMVNESTKKVFPDLEFVLIENNIKEGSYNEVCYPKIYGKETPFLNGSNSERILTGIRVIEDIRHFLEIDNIPIIFDEGETLDSESLANLKTNAQVITSVVDDNYTKPTIINL